MDEDYADDDEYDEATDDAVDTASRLFREPTRRGAGAARGDEGVGGAGRVASSTPRPRQLIALAERAHPARAASGPTSGSSSSPSTGPPRTGCTSVLAAEGLTGRRPAADACTAAWTRRTGSGSRRRSRPTPSSQPGPHPAGDRRRLEGIDLQNHCSPADPLRDPVEPEPAGAAERPHRPARPEGRTRCCIYHFVGKGYNDRRAAHGRAPVGDLEADLEFLMRAVRKVETIREDLGKVGPVIAEQVEEAMLGRRSRARHRRGPRRSAEPVRRMLKFERDLAKQIKALMDQYHETQRELRLSPENVQKVVEVALELAGQPPLDRRVQASGRPERTTARSSGCRP